MGEQEKSWIWIIRNLGRVASFLLGIKVAKIILKLATWNPIEKALGLQSRTQGSHTILFGVLGLLAVVLFEIIWSRVATKPKAR